MDKNSVPNSAEGAGLLQNGPAMLVKPAMIFMLLPVATYVFWSFVSYLISPLKKYPGPLLACK